MENGLEFSEMGVLPKMGGGGLCLKWGVLTPLRTMRGFYRSLKQIMS